MGGRGCRADGREIVRENTVENGKRGYRRKEGEKYRRDFKSGWRNVEGRMDGDLHIIHIIHK